jgi:Tn3 transposase DDE domain-containing protein
VPVQTVNALPSPRYFGRRRGITWLNAINDQVAGIGAVVVPGTMRDSLHILDRRTDRRRWCVPFVELPFGQPTVIAGTAFRIQSTEQVIQAGLVPGCKRDLY